MVWKFSWFPGCPKQVVTWTQQRVFEKLPQQSYASTLDEIQAYVPSSPKLPGNNFTASSWGVFPCQDFPRCSLPPCMILNLQLLTETRRHKYVACSRSLKHHFESSSSLETLMCYLLSFPSWPYLWEWKQTTNPTLLRANYLLCYSVFQPLP